MRTTMPISINLPKTWIAKLREISHKESLRTKEEIIYTDLIKKALKEKYPELEKEK